FQSLLSHKRDYSDVQLQKRMGFNMDFLIYRTNQWHCMNRSNKYPLANIYKSGKCHRDRVRPSALFCW
ncbi:hypothetical protein, partial [Xylanibacter muris]|uniref:hypothetical protein n=1 Tax=Xylanibacter muris TaxID=2736290 RepID=UPI0025A10345